MIRASIPDIIAAAAPMYGLTADELTRHSRQRKYCWPRQEVMAALAKTDRDIAEIGRAFGFHHTTVLNAISSLSVRRDKCRDAEYSFQEVLAVIQHMDARARRASNPVFRSVRSG